MALAYASDNPTADTGQTVVFRVYNATGVQVGGDIAATEQNGLAYYSADYPTAPAGEYLVRVFSNGQLVAQDSYKWSGSREVTASDEVFGDVSENGETYGEGFRLIRADAAGSVNKPGDGTYTIQSADGATARITGQASVNNGREITATDGS